MSSELLGSLKVSETPIEKLILQPENIRFTHLKKIRSDADIQKQLWKESETRSLYQQILAAKGVYEELIIDSDNVVLEGNRRLACLRVLRSEARLKKLPGIETTHFDKILCKVIPKGTSKKQIDLFLATIHVKGKKKWNAFNKAQLLHDLKTKHLLTSDEISKQLSVSIKTIDRSIDVYNQTYEYGKKYPSDNGWYHKFTYFDELFKKRDLVEFRRDHKNIVKFGDWLRKNKFHDVREVRLLANVLQNKHALQKLEEGTMADARKYLEPRDPAMISKEFRNIQKTIELLKYFPRKELLKTIQDRPRMTILSNLQKELDSIMKEIKTLEKALKAMPIGG